jgi:hypothetical protein
MMESATGLCRNKLVEIMMARGRNMGNGVFRNKLFAKWLKVG